VIFSHTTPVTAALQRQTRTIPIVFTFVGDPVGEGFVAGLPRPGGNITGFIPQEASMAGKWVELLTEIAPGVKRVAAIFNPDTEPFVRRHFLPSFEIAARSYNVVPIVAPVRSEAEIEKVMISLGREPGGGFGMLSCRSIAHSSYCWRHDTMCRGSISYLSLPGRAVCFPTEPMARTCFVVLHPTSIAFCAAQSPWSYPFSCRQNLRWS